MKTKQATKEVRTPGSSSSGCALSAPSVMLLHIDDDPNDAALLRAAAIKAELPAQIHNLEDADHAIAYMNGVGDYADRLRYALPALILLDLKMPRTTGLELLKWIRAHPQWNHLPVVVLSGSELRDDVERAYQAGANSYLVKPLGFEALVTLVKELSASWLEQALPGSKAVNLPVRQGGQSVSHSQSAPLS